MANTNLLTAQDVAGILSLSKRQIFRLNSCGKIPKPVKINNTVRWRQSDIENWISLDCPDRHEFEQRKSA